MWGARQAGGKGPGVGRGHRLARRTAPLFLPCRTGTLRRGCCCCRQALWDRNLAGPPARPAARALVKTPSTYLPPRSRSLAHMVQITRSRSPDHQITLRRVRRVVRRRDVIASGGAQLDPKRLLVHVAPLPRHRRHGGGLFVIRVVWRVGFGLAFLVLAFSLPQQSAQHTSPPHSGPNTRRQNRSPLTPPRPRRPPSSPSSRSP